eukprot:ctg_3139.g410
MVMQRLSDPEEQAQVIASAPFGLAQPRPATPRRRAARRRKIAGAVPLVNEDGTQQTPIRRAPAPRTGRRAPDDTGAPC